MMHWAKVVAALLSAGSGAVWASAIVNIDIRDGLNGEQVASDSETVAASKTFSFGGGTGTGSADLSAGILKEFALAPALRPGGVSSYTQTNSRISDTVSFNQGATGTAYLQWSVDGTLPTFDGISDSTATMAFFISGAGNSISETHYFVNNSCAPYSGTTCESGTSFVQAGQIAISVGSGPISIDAFLQAYPEDGGTGDFSNTGKIFLVVPAGVTYTSGTGQFLVNATPLTPFPEPSTYLLLLLGAPIVLTRSRAHRAT